MIPRHTAGRLLVFFGILHGLLLLFDLAHPQRFLYADRAQERFEAMGAFALAWRDGQGIQFLSTHGIPGDWLPHAVLYLAGGQFLIIAVQVALVLAAIAGVQVIARRMGLGEGPAAAAALVYGLLPHTLVFPHQLASEALFGPLVVFGFAGALGARTGLAMGLATLVRPVTLLWPFIHALFSRAGNRAAYLLAAILPLLAWMTFMWATTGEFSQGKSSHDLGHNLYQRIHRMSANLPEAERPAPRPPGQTTVSLGEYLRFVAQHPKEAVMHGVRDVATLGVKSGIERLALDYLDLFPESRASLQDSDEGWRARMERAGMLAAVRDMLRERPGMMLVSGFGALLFCVFMILSIIGATERRYLTLTLFVVYIFLTAQAIDAAQSRHRAPAEFALCVLAVAGWLRLRHRKAAPQSRPLEAAWQHIRS
jgi:hypothetical protein